MKKPGRDQRHILIDAVEQTVIGMIVVDLAGYIMAVNTSFAQMFGYEREFLVGRHLRIFYSPDQMPEVEAINRHIRQTGSYMGEIQHQHRDGRKFPGYICNALFRDDQGQPMGIIGTLHDITRRRQQEEDRLSRERRRMQIRKTESLNRMAGAVAHRFNNYLSAVMGNLELAAAELPAAAVARDLLAEAMTAAQQAAGVSRLMLTYLGMNPGTTESSDLVRSCRQYLAPVADSLPARIRLTTDIAPGPLKVPVTREQIRMILEHLLANAREAIGEERGQIRLALKTLRRPQADPRWVVPPDWEPRNERYACLEVTDTGCGINEQQFDQLFDPFFSEKFTGRGLGLAVVLGIARGCGGAVAVCSRPGEGSCFQVFLPLAVEDAENDADLSVPAENAAFRRTVLLVEDEPVVRTVCREMLEHLEVTVFAAADGSQGLELFQQHQQEIGAIFCDVAMPGMDGWETLAAVRRLDDEVPVIMVSGFEESWAMAEKPIHRPQVFIKKPFTIEDLKSALTAVWKDPPPP
ncbi:MAG: hybrid sensor histidine kinase/response regulator [Desulfosudaceae bacterium]